MKILITGAGGNLGRALQAVLRDRHELTLLSHGDLDITTIDGGKPLPGHRPDIIINAAAYNDVDRAETEKAKAYKVNALGPALLAGAAKQACIPIVHVSTDYVFDGTKGGPYIETDSTHPLSSYAQTKLEGEDAVRRLHPDQHFIIRTAWLYNNGGKNFPERMFDLAKKGGELKVANDQISSPTFAPHLAEKIGKLIETQDYGTYHIAGAGEASRFEWIRFLFEATQVKTKVVPGSANDFKGGAVRPAYSALGTSKGQRYVLPPWQEGAREFSQNYF